MNGFFGYLLRTWLDRARSKLRGTLFGLILVTVALQTLLCVFLLAASWLNGPKLERLATEGIQAEATIESVDVYVARLGWKTTKLNLAWTDAAGTTRRQTVLLSDEFAPKIVSGHRAIRPTLPIKYLSGEPDADVLLLDDAGRQNAVNAYDMSVGAIGLGLCALGLAVLYAVRRHVRRKYPGLPASFTSWPNIRFRIRMIQMNSFFRVFMQYKHVTAPLLAGLTYGLKYTGIFEIIESLAGTSEYGTWLILVLASVAIMGVSGWCYDRYGEWRSETRSQESIPSVTS